MFEFVSPFELMLNTERVIQLENDRDRHDETKCIERVKKPTILANKSFHSLNVSNHWNIPYNHQNGMAKVKGPCDNCGGEHYSPDCPYSWDKAKIKKAKEKSADHRGGGGRNGGGGGGHGGGIQGDRNKWRNDNRDEDRNYYVNGVQ